MIGGKNDKIEAVLLWTHHEKARLFGKKQQFWGNIEGSRERGRSNLRWFDCIKEAIGLSLQELSRAVEDRTLWTSLIHRVARRWSPLKSI